MKEYELLVVGEITPRTLQTLVLEQLTPHEHHEPYFLTKHLQSYYVSRLSASHDNGLIILFTREQTQNQRSWSSCFRGEQQVSLGLIESPGNCQCLSVGGDLSFIIHILPGQAQPQLCGQISRQHQFDCWGAPCQSWQEDKQRESSPYQGSQGTVCFCHNDRIHHPGIRISQNCLYYSYHNSTDTSDT